MCKRNRTETIMSAAWLVSWALLGLLLFAPAPEATTRYVTPTGAGTRDGSSWTNAGPPSGQTTLSWLNNVMLGGDTTYFGPGTYLGEIRPPANTNSNDRTCYAAGDGVTPNLMYDPGVASLSVPFTRSEFEQSLLVAKACTLTSATRLAPGTTWTNYSGNIYYASASLLPFRFWPTDRAYCGGQDTTVLDGRPDLGSMTQGSFFHDNAAGRVYVWCTDNSNPTTHTIWASSSCTIDFDGLPNSNYVTFYGFDIRWNYYAGIHLAASGVDSVFVDHCRITKVFSQTASNAGIVGCQTIMLNVDCGGYYDCTYPYDGKYNRIRACYGAQIYEPGMDPNRCKLITTYAQSHMVVESCLAVGIGGVDWKNQAGGGTSLGNVFRFNTVKYWTTTAYENLSGHNQQDSCYGNIFIGDPTNNDMKGIWFQYSSLAGNTQHGSGHFVANNVFYQCQNAIASGIYDDYDIQPNWIKYNIFHGGGQAQYSQMHYQFSNDTNFISDSNAFYGLPANHINRNGYPMSLASWQTYQSGNWAGGVYHDLNSVTYNPNFVNGPGGDFRRTSAPSEMYLWYAGKLWTRFGAEQEESTPPPPLTSLVVDSLHCDFSGETDSLRTRFVTSAQAWPDSVIVALSTVTTALPVYSQPTDRWAKAFKGQSATDTLAIIKAITESDTIIVGGWVKDVDSGYSAGVYDTLILAGPPAATGACCYADGTCLVQTQAVCQAGGGSYQGDASSCSPNPCPQPQTGACCNGSSCTITSQATCIAGGGNYQGNNTTCSPDPCAGGSPVTTIDSVTTGTDDCNRYSTSSISTTSVALPLGNTGNANTIGLRFSTVNVPKGAVITAAKIQLYAGSSYAAGTIALNIRGEASSAPATYSTYTNFDARGLYAPTVAWNTTAASLTAATWHDSPDISAVVQEIVNQSDWAAGNNLAIQLLDNGSTGYRNMQSANHSEIHPPILVVTYTSNGGEPPIANPRRRIIPLGQAERLNEMLVYIRPNRTPVAPDTFFIALQETDRVVDKDHPNMTISYVWDRNRLMWKDWLNVRPRPSPGRTADALNADVDRDNVTDVADLMRLIDYLFFGL